ncbi:hypothetical protein CVT26_001593 [Gymnopilus dilepis]|uniref:Uncharacterized protein n=1 Tax=Gymnopilus dilepis TaxID=231916 RepID=A0A409X4X4_9AGAR|nr:hypothetical protein CVT26_001593 [Gymnopilus dilepis]
MDEVPFETLLLRQQAHAENLTSFRCYPFPGQLYVVPYPLGDDRLPVAPELLVQHSRTHRFRLPFCFHGRTVKMVTRSGEPGSEGPVTLECAVRGGNEVRCPYYGISVNVTGLLSDDCNMECRSYLPRKLRGKQFVGKFWDGLDDVER